MVLASYVALLFRIIAEFIHIFVHALSLMFKGKNLIDVELLTELLWKDDGHALHACG